MSAQSRLSERAGAHVAVTAFADIVRRALLASVQRLFTSLDAGGDVVFGVLGSHLLFLFSWMDE